MTAPLFDNATTNQLVRTRVRRNERRSLVRRFDHAVEAIEAALERMRSIMAELALLDHVDAELDGEAEA